MLGSNRRRGFTIPTIFRAKNLNYQEEIPKEGSNRELNILPILRAKNLNYQQINIFDNLNITLDTIERLMVFRMISVYNFTTKNVKYKSRRYQKAISELEFVNPCISKITFPIGSKYTPKFQRITSKNQELS